MGREPRYTCNICWDRGTVHVWNPRFIEEFRTRFGGMEYSVDWYGVAYSWWRRNFPDSGPIRHVALCSCTCESAARFRRELDRWRNQERKTPPACGCHEYNPSVFLLVRPGRQWTDLEEWYKTHQPNQTNQWCPDPGEYQEAFGQ